MPPSTARFVNGLLGGDLEERLRTMRRDGYSYGVIAVALNNELPDDCAIDPATIRRYCAEYGIDQ